MGKFRYTTGPCVNESSSMYAFESVYTTVTVLATNNSHKRKAKVTITLYELDDKKTRITSKSMELAPQQTKSVDLNIASLAWFSIDIKGKQEKKSNVLFSVTGKDEIGGLVYILPLTKIH